MIDYPLLYVALLLSLIGVVMIFSASYYYAYYQFNDSYYFLKKQLIGLLLGIIVMYITSQLDYRIFKKLSILLYVIGTISLILVLIPGIGKLVNNARRWIDIGPVQFQPSELAKYALVILLASYLDNTAESKSKFKIFVISILLSGVYFALIYKEPNMSTSILILGITMLMLFAAGLNISYFVTIGVLSLPVLYYLTIKEEYRVERIQALFNPWADPTDKGYQIIQSLYAIGSGGLFGMGLGQSRQKLLYIPEPHTDFIFSILCEELGFVGAVFVIVLFILFIWRGIVIALHARDRFGTLLAFGVTSIIATQAILNIAVVTASVPATGVPLPFITYGGSSILFHMFGVGVLLSISRRIKVLK
ncbi:putative lipid II flippase FtsW [Caldicellulosiruptor changbaiensis]|uniref:Probable peptidoglycan glycosyltransferase FtsW n=1 Tax=Caldicellulosiruptor changbaiensis TaxID=1222016 RepID=A0A3T0D9C8_9FIRM|nr:putative lipid II flippase FtsW [Caldicellulosiruptor changbaiensis]AZT91687.1 putative lipid II flippase FtsW [Caldicellulosiruptor changbaiensis]